MLQGNRHSPTVYVVYVYCLGLKTPRLYWDRQFVKFLTVDFVNCSLRLLGIEDRKLEFGEKHRKE